MKKILFCLMLLTAPFEAPAQARTFNQAELDALLAPVALYPDALLSQILVAATYPDQVAEAARGGQSPRWHPAVTALTAYPEVLARMAENPQWLRDLGEAYLGYEPYVMETVQQLRRRAEAAGNLRSDAQQQVIRQGETIVVQPVYPQVVVAPYYNPLVVFGTWWWTTYRPVMWRPWIAHPVVVHSRPPLIKVVRVVHTPPHRTIHVAPPHRPLYRPVQVHSAPAPVALHKIVSLPAPRPHVSPPQAHRQPVARSAPRPQFHATARSKAH